MDTKYKYYDKVVEYYSHLIKNKIYKINQKLYYATHLNGPHLDFFYEPFSLNKNTPLRNFKKFNKSILKSMSNLSFCEKYGLFLKLSVVKIMSNQVETILTNDVNYWKKYNFDDVTITNIIKVYMMYKLYLETYTSRIKNTFSENIKLSYMTALETHLGMHVNINKLIELANNQIHKNVLTLESLHGINFNLILEKFKNFGSHCESESELLSLAMKHILILYHNAQSNIAFANIEIPEPHTIKLKWTKSLKAQWSSKSEVFGRYLFLNNSNVSSYKKEHLLRLVTHEVIPGHIMFRTNTNKFIKSYFDYKNTKPKRKIKKLIKSGIKSINEGFASHIEKYILTIENNLWSQTILLFNKLLHAIRLKLDIQLNMGLINEEYVINTLKKYTILSDDDIEVEINRYYAQPGKSCACCFGNCYYDLLEKIYYENKSNDFYSDMFTLQLPFNLIFEYVNEKFNHDIKN